MRKGREEALMGVFGEVAHVGAIVIGALRNACRQQSKKWPSAIAQVECR